MTKKTNNLYEFGKFRLDAKERALWQEEEFISLPPKVFDTLLMLVENQGKVLSKTEMLDAIWADSFVEESNLSQNIYTLRQKLGRDESVGNFIETVPRRGYRFAVPVTAISDITKSAEKSVDFDSSAEILIAEETRTEIIEEEIIEDSTKPQLSPIHEKTSLKSKNFLTGLLFGTFAVLILGTLGFWSWNKNFSDSNDSLSGNIKFAQLTDSENILNLTISPKGKFLAYIAHTEGSEKVFRLKDIDLDQTVKLEIPNTYNADFLQFSPDGNYIYFRHRNGINQSSDVYKITRFGGEAKLVAENIWSEFSLSSDEKQIAFYRRNPQNNEHSLIIRNLGNKEEKILATRNVPEGFAAKSTPVWSADGKNMFAISRPQKSHTSKIVSIDIENGKETIIETPQLKIVRQIVPMPNGKKLILIAREKEKTPQLFKLNLANNKLQKITNDLLWYPKISLSADGKHLAALQKVFFSHLWFLPEAKFENATQLTKEKAARDGTIGLDIFPDGKILYVSLADNNRDLWTIDVENKIRQQLTEKNGDVNDFPFISQNSEKIYFVAIKKAVRKIHRMDFDGQNFEQVSSNENSNDLYPVTSKDGKTLFFIKQTKETTSIWQKKMPDGKEEKLPVPDGILPDGLLEISLDGKLLAFQQIGSKTLKSSSNDSKGKIKIGIISIEDTSFEPKFIQIPTNLNVIRWTETSDAFDFVEQTQEGPIIWRQSILDESEPQKILQFPQMKVFNFFWMPNNKDLILSKGKNQDDAVLITNFD